MGFLVYSLREARPPGASPAPHQPRGVHGLSWCALARTSTAKLVFTVREPQLDGIVTSRAHGIGGLGSGTAPASAGQHVATGKPGPEEPASDRGTAEFRARSPERPGDRHQDGTVTADLDGYLVPARVEEPITIAGRHPDTVACAGAQWPSVAPRLHVHAEPPVQTIQDALTRRQARQFLLWGLAHRR